MTNPSIKKWEELYDYRLSVMNRDYLIEDWTDRSEDFSESRKTDNYQYGRTVYDVLTKNRVIFPDSRVIEVGSGPGTFVIPFATKISHVTAVEPAQGMITKIKDNACEASIQNFDIIPLIWQDVNIDQISKTYDLVISSTVIWMFRDIMEQIKRMEKVSSGYCCLCDGIGGGHNSEELWMKVVGDTNRPPSPEYPLMYNILYEHGIFPEVRIIEHESRRSPENMVTMYKVYFNLYTSLNTEKKR